VGGESGSRRLKDVKKGRKGNTCKKIFRPTVHGVLILTRDNPKKPGIKEEKTSLQ